MAEDANVSADANAEGYDENSTAAMSLEEVQVSSSPVSSQRYTLVTAYKTWYEVAQTFERPSQTESIEIFVDEYPRVYAVRAQQQF